MHGRHSLTPEVDMHWSIFMHMLISKKCMPHWRWFLCKPIQQILWHLGELQDSFWVDEKHYYKKILDWWSKTRWKTCVHKNEYFLALYCMTLSKWVRMQVSLCGMALSAFSWPMAINWLCENLFKWTTKISGNLLHQKFRVQETSININAY